MTTRISDIQVILTAPEGINLIVVKVLTNQPGLYGLGCATLSYRHLAVKCVVEQYLKPLLIGRATHDIEALWQLMHQNAYWRNGPIENNAISGVDMALWDLLGKEAGKPLYQLFGGKSRAGITVYRHADGRDHQEVMDNIARWMESGVTHLRCQLGGYGGGQYGNAPDTAPHGALDGIYLDSYRYRTETLKLFEEVRNRFGFEVAVCHDVHERLSPVDAIQFAQDLDAYKLFFLEDPVSLEDLDALKQLRQKTSTPIAQGELFTHPAEWRTLISQRLIDFIRVHMSHIGGITPARKLQLFAEAHGVRTAWHGPGDMSPVGHAANIHIDLASKNFGIQEWSGTEPPNHVIQKVSKAKDALLSVFSGLPECIGGYVYPNDLPGLGVDIDEQQAAKFPCHNDITTWTQTRQRDGSLQVP
jgi:mannonate dehydratase